MGLDEGFVAEKRKPKRPWPWPGIPEPPGWNPDGLLGGIEDPPRSSSLELLMTPEQLADAGIGQAGAQDASQGAKSGGGLGGQSDDGLGGIRPAAWDAPAPDSGGQPRLTTGQIDPDRLAPGRPEGNAVSLGEDRDGHLVQAGAATGGLADERPLEGGGHADQDALPRRSASRQSASSLAHLCAGVALC